MSHVSTTIQTCQFIGLHCICSFVIVLALQVTSSSSATGKNDITARIFSPPPTLRLEPSWKTLIKNVEIDVEI